MADYIARYGWIPDLPDQRDHLYAAPRAVLLQPLPSSIDLRAQCPPVYNQGNLGSCTANAIAGAIEFDNDKQGLPPFTPSRLFIYYNERAMEGTIASDSGAQIRDGIKSVGKQGDCSETTWPYDIATFTQKPPDQAYAEARAHTAVQYQRVAQNLTQMKGCLADGYPFVLGISVYDSFESPQVAADGHVPLPGSGEQLLGGHAVLAVGYDDENKWFIVRNSWGDGWGMKGYFTLPYAYVTQPSLSSDFWTVRLIA